MARVPSFMKTGRRKFGLTIGNIRVRLLIYVAAAGLALGIGMISSDTRQQVPTAENLANVFEALAFSSVAGSVPGREAVRKAQAAAIMEAQRMGLEISIASVGTGGKHGSNSAADEQAFARLALHFLKTLKAAKEGNRYGERISKAWISGSAALVDVSEPSGSSQIVSDAKGTAGACVVELHSSGESLRAMLTMMYDESSIFSIERKARSLGISAADVAFLVAAHESAHCVIGMALRTGLFDISWADPHWQVPSSWCEDERDSPILAKAEESSADILAVLLAADTLGSHKARHLLRLAIYARSRGAQSNNNDGLHDSSRVLTRILALSQVDHYLPVANPARLAWTAATLDTRGEVLERIAHLPADGRARQ